MFHQMTTYITSSCTIPLTEQRYLMKAPFSWKVKCSPSSIGLFNLKEREVRSLPFLCGFNVPTHLWSPGGFISQTSAIGKLKCMEKITEEDIMLTYGKICVKIEPNKELPSSIPWSKDVVVKVEYPWKSLICTKGSVFGHSILQCLKKIAIL